MSVPADILIEVVKSFTDGQAVLGGPSIQVKFFVDIITFSFFPLQCAYELLAFLEVI